MGASLYHCPFNLAVPDDDNGNVFGFQPVIVTIVLFKLACVRIAPVSTFRLGFYRPLMSGTSWASLGADV